MADWLTPEQRRRNMSSIRSRGNATTEKVFASLLRKERITGWRRHQNLPGKPDFIFRHRKLAVFVDGCFWHGCPRCYRQPRDNRKYWKAKVESNRRRDRRVNETLRSAGWTVMRIWEHSLKNPRARDRVLERVQNALKKSKTY